MYIEQYQGNLKGYQQLIMLETKENFFQNQRSPLGNKHHPQGSGAVPIFRKRDFNP